MPVAVVSLAILQFSLENCGHEGVMCKKEIDMSNYPLTVEFCRGVLRTNSNLSVQMVRYRTHNL